MTLTEIKVTERPDKAHMIQVVATMIDAKGEIYHWPCRDTLPPGAFCDDMEEWKESQSAFLRKLADFLESS